MATPDNVANKATLMTTRRRVLTKNAYRICDSSSEDYLYPLAETVSGITFESKNFARGFPDIMLTV
jgi:hypothetical protein